MRPAALTETGKKLFPKLESFAKDFYLVGGTALALQIGHRVSVDFDMFSNEELPKPLLAKVRRVFKGTPIFPTINNPDQMNIDVAGVKMTFFWYQYPLVLPLVEYQGVPMVSLPEIAVMKAFAVGQRGTFRDYVDLYFLLAEKHTTLPEIIELGEKKYKREFHSRLFLEQLLYLTDVRDASVEFLRDPVTREQIQSFMEDAVRSFKL